MKKKKQKSPDKKKYIITIATKTTITKTANSSVRLDSTITKTKFIS